MVIEGIYTLYESNKDKKDEKEEKNMDQTWMKSIKQTVKSSNLFYWFLKREWGFYIDLTVYILSVTIAQAGYFNIELDTLFNPKLIFKQKYCRIHFAKHE